MGHDARSIRRSPFDERVFGVPFYRVVDPFSERLPMDIVHVCKEHVTLIVDAKIPADARGAHRQLLDLGMDRICTQITLEAPPGPPELGSEVTRAARLDLPRAELQQHARGFRHQRFAQDPRMDETRVHHFMSEWIANSLGGTREVLHLPGAFLSFSDDGTFLVIDLISSLAPGRGSLLLVALAAEACSRMRTGLRATTEAENCRALRAYARAHYLPVRSTTCFHLVRRALPPA